MPAIVVQMTSPMCFGVLVATAVAEQIVPAAVEATVGGDIASAVVVVEHIDSAVAEGNLLSAVVVAVVAAVAEDSVLAAFEALQLSPYTTSHPC